jgi:hypothetical protein
MFSPLGDDAYTFEKQAITYNHHNWGIKQSSFQTDVGLSSMFTPTSISYDEDGVAFVASMESKQYPFFGT